MKLIRPATQQDIERIAAIESLCFPAAEAATLSSFQARFDVFPDCFFVLELDGNIIGHVNGCRYDQPALPDELFEDATLHNSSGQYQTVFGLAVDPAFQRQGFATELLQHFITESQSRQLCGMFLTCKQHLIEFYSHCGFACLGISESQHGGAQWYDMLLEFK